MQKCSNTFSSRCGDGALDCVKHLVAAHGVVEGRSRVICSGKRIGDLHIRLRDV
jgi:hypothetical protein